MRISPISAVSISRYVQQVRPVQVKSTPTKPTRVKKKRRSKSLNDELDILDQEIDSTSDVDKAPEYDPELDMIAERVEQAKASFRETSHTPLSPFHVAAPHRVQPFSAPITGCRGPRSIPNDKFTYFTLIEGIIIYNLLYKKLPKDLMSFTFETHEIDREKKRLIGVLHLYVGHDTVKKYRLTYDIMNSIIDIEDCVTGQSAGKVDFELTKTDYRLEKAQGVLHGDPIVLDPEWNKSDSSRISYQALKVGHRRLDLTATSRDHRMGQWSFSGTEPAIPFEVMIESTESKKDHFLTKKTITMGRHRVTVSQKYIDDSIPEPYEASGKICLLRRCGREYRVK